MNSDDGAVAVGDIGILKTSCVSYDRFNPYESKPVVKDELQSVKCAVEKDSVIVSRMNTPERVGACGYVSTDFPNLFLPDRLWKLKFQDNVDAYFVYMMLVSSVYKEKITSMASGTSGSMYNIPKETFLNLQLVVPVQTSEQRKIGQVLRQLNDFITLHQRKYDKLQVLKKAMLEKMFPKNGSSVPEIRFKGFTDAWEQRKLGDFCEMFNGDRSAKYPNEQDMVHEGIPFINAGDLENGCVNLLNANKITTEKYNDLGGAKLQLGDIVYCLRGTLGKNAYIDNFSEGTVASSLVAIRPKNIDGKYLFYILNSDIEYSQRILHDEGAAQPNLSAKSVSEFIIPIPNIDEQKKLSSFFDSLSNLITLHQRELEKLQNIKKSMLEKMFV